MQTQADLTGVPVQRPKNVETTAMGAAMLAGIGAGLWDASALARLAVIDRRFGPSLRPEDRALRVAGYRTAVRLAAEKGA